MTWPLWFPSSRLTIMTEQLRVDVFADPGLPSHLVSRLLDDQQTDSTKRYALSHNRSRIPLRDDGSLDMATVREWSQRNEADLLVIVTEIPRRAGHQPKLVALHFAEGLAIISLPALGSWGLTSRLRAATLDALDALVKGAPLEADEGRVKSVTVHEQEAETGRSVYLTSPWWWPGRVRLVLGMVRTNQPLKVVPELSGVLAAASATGAFGVFFSSIWSMAAALPGWRLALVTLLSICAMTAWLIFSNRLWEPKDSPGALQEARIYNASTVTTLVFAVAILYLSLFVGILFAAFVVIDSQFMGQSIGSGATPMSYVDIAWLSASMGTVAGALGSNFDHEQSVRNVTHGLRMQQRYWARQEESATTGG